MLNYPRLRKPGPDASLDQGTGAHLLRHPAMHTQPRPSASQKGVLLPDASVGDQGRVLVGLPAVL